MADRKLKDLEIVRFLTSEFIRGYRKTDVPLLDTAAEAIRLKAPIREFFMVEDVRGIDFVVLRYQLDLYWDLHDFARDIYGATLNHELTVYRTILDFIMDDRAYLSNLFRHSHHTISEMLSHDWSTPVVASITT